MTPIRFEITARCGTSRARVGRVDTPHGSFDTPAFMPVGTRGSVKGLLPSQVATAGAQIILANTYHMLLRPGPDIVERLGGLHRFMNWHGPILTDSGGYQAYSMADINAVDDDGVTFRSIVDGAMIRLTPESATATQNKLGADIIMAFDDCPPSVDPASAPVNQARLRHAVARDQPRRGYDHPARLRLANERTVCWLERCVTAHARAAEQALFGIVQGGTDLDQRRWSVERICNIDLPGYAIGGVAVGEGTDEIARVVRATAPLLPELRPRYLMGVGYERDIVTAVLSGVDMFDCVLPTRNGRNACAFTRRGVLRLRNARFAEDPAPIEQGCDCLACAGGLPLRGKSHASAERQTTHEGAHAAERQATQGADSHFSRAFLRHLFMAGEMLGPILVSLHNVRHFERLMSDIRRAIIEDQWPGFAREWTVVGDVVQSETSIRPAH